MSGGGALVRGWGSGLGVGHGQGVGHWLGGRALV